MGDSDPPEGGNTSPMSGNDPISLLVANDVQLVVEGLVAMMEPFDKRITIAGAAIGELEPIRAEVGLVDAFGHPNAGVERISEVVDLGSVDKVCLYTWKLTPAQAVEAIDRGAAGILSKSAPATELVRDIERVHAGDRVVNGFPVHVWTPTWLETSDASLTPRELELLSFVATGLTNAEISRAMFLAESSVKTYLKRVYRKLGINSRSQAVMRAVELGIAGPHAGSGAAG